MTAKQLIRQSAQGPRATLPGFAARRLMQRVLSASLLLLLTAFSSAPAAFALLSDGHEKGCCRMKDHCCCLKVLRQQEGPALAARACAPECRLAGGSDFRCQSLGSERVTIAAFTPAELESAVLARTDSPISSYLAFLHQRPPPIR